MTSFSQQVGKSPFPPITDFREHKCFLGTLLTLQKQTKETSDEQPRSTAVR